MKNIILISLIISLIGIFTLLILLNTLPPKQLKISEIQNKHLNQQVQIKGTLTSIKNYQESDFQILTIEDSTGEIQATLNKISNLTINSSIILIGTPLIYKQSIQIKTDKIIILF